MSKNLVTKKGTQLPLIQLKGKDYLMVAYRLQWLAEDVENYLINTQTTQKTEESATVQATITILTPDGKVVRAATARKTEAKKDFNDFEEKAETGAIGRALAFLGFGTQHALADLDEGSRIVDSPVVDTKQVAAAPANGTTPKKPSSFNQSKKDEADEWS